MILLAAHSDTVVPVPFPGVVSGMFSGLLDNSMGIASIYASLGRSQSLMRAVREGKLCTFHVDSEEFLLPLEDIPVKPDLAIVVDVVSGEKYEGINAAIENLTIEDKTFGKDLEEMLMDEGYKVTLKRFDGTPMDQDEAWMWKDLNVPTFSLLLPINAPNSCWHHPNSTCSIQAFDTFVNILIRTINFCWEDYGQEKR